MLYNPFEQLTRATFQEFLEQGYRQCLCLLSNHRYLFSLLFL